MAKSKPNPLVFKSADAIKNSIMESQEKEIAKLYQDWSKEIMTNIPKGSSIMYVSQTTKLSAALTAQSKVISNEVAGIIQRNIYTVSDSVVNATTGWLKDIGFPNSKFSVAMSSVPKEIVNRLVTGQVYESGWSLSKRIWTDNEATLKDIYTIVASGVAQNLPIYDIAKNLEKYVDPSKALPWNLRAPDGRYIHKKKVDYNAQRLARTLVQHSYQQTFVAATEKNPFVLQYQWLANGSRSCPICQDRDGTIYEKGSLPLDHPNGMCTMIPIIDGLLTDKLADWFNTPDGTYPEIDEFAKDMGYSVQAKEAGITPKMQAFADKYFVEGYSAAGWQKLGAITQEIIDEAAELVYENGMTLSDFIIKWNEAKKGIPSVTPITVPKPKAPPKPVKPKATPLQKFSDKYLADENLNNMGYDKWYKYHKANDPKFDNELYKLATKEKLPYQSFFEKYNKGLPMDAKDALQSLTTADRTTWMDKIKAQVQKDILKKEKVTLKVLTPAEKSAIKEYSGSSFREMNAYLRAKKSGLSDVDAMALSGLDDEGVKTVKLAQSALRKTTLDEDMVLRRGSNVGDLAGFMDNGQDFDTNFRSLIGKTPEELDQMFGGTVGELASFTSTSSIWDKGFQGYVETVFYAPKGTSASSIMSVSQFGTAEGETLLNAGQRVRIDRVEKSDGHMGSKIRVYMEILVDNLP